MAPNHGGDPLGPILGPMRSHWGQNLGQNRKKLPCPKIRISTTPRSSISAKIGRYGYGAKSRWGPPRAHLGANEVPLGPKFGSKPQKITMSQNSNFQPKFELYAYGAKSRWGPLGSILGPMGSRWVPKMGQNRKKLPCPEIRILDYPAVFDFGQNLTLRLWSQITVGIP